MLNESLFYEVPSVRLAAIEALPDFFTEYYSSTDKVSQQNSIIELYTENLKAQNKITQMGHLLAIGKMVGILAMVFLTLK